jgi:hypothetical protein
MSGTVKERWVAGIYGLSKGRDRLLTSNINRANVYDMSTISSAVGRGRGMAAGERGDIAPGEWLDGCRRKGFRVCVREIGDAKDIGVRYV